MGIRLAILINCLEAGGAQRVALSIYKGLSGLLESVRLYQIHKDIEPIHEAYGLTLHGNRVLGGGFNDSRFFSKLLLTGLACSRLNQYSRRDDINVLLSFMERSNILNLLTTGSHKRIISVRNYPSSFIRKKSLLKRMSIYIAYPPLLRRADIINFNSFEAAKDFSRLFGVPHDKISVIYNMIDINNVKRLGNDELPPEHKSIFEKDVVVNVGRLVGQKAQSRLIRAFRHVCNEFPDARLAIIGGGPLHSSLTKLTIKLGLRDRVLMLGHIANPFPYVRRSKVFVLCSVNEGFPNVLVEAMALGKPVIAGDCSSGPREILAPGTDPSIKARGPELARYGILVPPFYREFLGAEEPITPSELELAEVIKLVLSDNAMQKKYSLMSLKRVENFSPSVILDQWISLFGAQVARGADRY